MFLSFTFCSVAASSPFWANVTIGADEKTFSKETLGTPLRFLEC